MARDTILRGAMPFVESLAPGDAFDVKELVEYLRRRGGGRYSESSLRSIFNPRGVFVTTVNA